MIVKVRKFGDQGHTLYKGVTTVQSGKDGTIVWLSEDTYDADIMLTIDEDDHIVGPDESGTLWVRGPEERDTND